MLNAVLTKEPSQISKFAKVKHPSLDIQTSTSVQPQTGSSPGGLSAHGFLPSLRPLVVAVRQAVGAVGRLHGEARDRGGGAEHPGGQKATGQKGETKGVFNRHDQKILEKNISKRHLLECSKNI